MHDVMYQTFFVCHCNGYAMSSLQLKLVGLMHTFIKLLFSRIKHELFIHCVIDVCSVHAKQCFIVSTSTHLLTHTITGNNNCMMQLNAQ